MYRTHFGLRKVPFSVGLDPEFLWLGEKHQATLAELRSGVLENKGVLVLTGGVGTGKTSLVRNLLAGLSAQIVAASVEDPGLSNLDLLNIISNELKMAPAVHTKADFHIEFNKFVENVLGSGKRILIVIDEAQRLTSRLLQEICALFNIGEKTRKLVNVLLVGQVEFERMLANPSNQALRDHIALSFRISSLSPEETGAYIRYRLEVAGARKELFTEGAVQEVFNFSKGIPRLVNILCDRALISGYLRKLAVLDPDLVRECAAKLDMASVAAATEVKTAPRAGSGREVHEARDNFEAGIRPAEARRKWLAPVGLCAAGLLLFALIYTSTHESAPPQTPLLTPLQNMSAGSPGGDFFSESSAGRPPALETPGAEEASGIEFKAAGPAAGEGKTFYLFFKPLSAELEDESYSVLRQAVALLAENPDSEITLICHPARDGLPPSRAKLWNLRATGISSVLSTQPNFKGLIKVIEPDTREMAPNRKLPDSGRARAHTEMQIKPGPGARENKPQPP